MCRHLSRWSVRRVEGHSRRIEAFSRGARGCVRRPTVVRPSSVGRVRGS